MHAMTVAIDLAKNVFEIAMSDGRGHVLARRRLSRGQLGAFLETLSPHTWVVMEACGTAHYWGRRCQSHGIPVRLLPPQYVRPYVRRNKTDRSDAEALLEAHRCGGLHPVPVKTVEQQMIQALHRVRRQWQRTRTARINLVRALLREQGIVFPLGAATLARRVAAVIEDAEVPLPDLLRASAQWILNELEHLEAQLDAVDRRLTQLARTHPVARRLQEVPGVGVLTATALVGAVSHIQAFRRGRQFASWLGLTPRETSSGMRRVLGAISKHGDRYLRTLLVHGARAVLRAAEIRAQQRAPTITRLQQWALTLAGRRGRNRTTIALANKLARIIWAVWSRDESFRPAPVGA